MLENMMQGVYLVGGITVTVLIVSTLCFYKYYQEPTGYNQNVTKPSKPTFEEFRKTLRSGNHENIQRLIYRGFDVNTTYPDKRTPLHESANMGDAKITKLLLEAGAKVNCTEPFYGQTPLHWATEEGYTDIIEVLLSYGANPDACSEAGVKNKTPLHVAAWKGWSDVVNQLLDAGACVNSQTENGEVPLHMAVEMRHSDIQKILINAGADLSLIDKDCESKLLKTGMTTRALMDQADLETLDEIPKDKVKSTGRFVEKVSVKVILLGNSGVGKTSLLQSVREGKPMLTEPGADGRTIGIELTVLDIEVHPDIHSFVYDFGGQDVYAPLRQTLITPHSLYCLVVDLDDFFHHLNDEEYFNTNITDFYYTVYQHVFSPVFQIIGTKADLLKPEQINQCCKKITEGVWNIEQREIEVLEIRKRELRGWIDAKRALQTTEPKSDSFKFQGLSSQHLDEKMLEIDEKMHPDKRPKLPKDVVVVSSRDFTGMKQWKDDIANKVISNKGAFPSKEIPETWLHLDERLLQNKDKVSMTHDDFFQTCEQFDIKDEEEKGIFIHFFRNVGRILYFENHPGLKNTIFLNPDTILKALSGIFNHRHFEETFWKNNKTLTKLPHSTVCKYKEMFQDGKATKTVMRSFLSETVTPNDVDYLIELMCKLDLCFKLPGDSSKHPEDCYLIPSLLETSPSAEKRMVLPSDDNRIENVIGVSVCLNTAREPSGLFEKFTTRIDNHLIESRFDCAKFMTAEINHHGDELQVEIDRRQEHIRILLLVKFGFGRHRVAVNMMKVLITNMIHILSYYPNVLWDMYTICIPCHSKQRLHCEHLPVETCLFSSPQTRSFCKCCACESEFEIQMSFPLSKVYLRKFRHDAFEDLVHRAYPRFGEDWKFMTRFLFPSVDEADQVIDKIEADSLYKDCLIGLAWQAIEKCRQEYDEEATTKRLLAAIHHLNKKKIMDPKNFEASYFGEEDLKEAAKQIAAKEKTCTESMKRGAVKQIVLKVSQEVPENAWRKLQDLLHYYTHTTDGDEAALTEMDKRHDELPVREKTYQMLRAWRRAALEGATCRLLIKALQEIRLSDVAKKVEDICLAYNVKVGDSLQHKKEDK